MMAISVQNIADRFNAVVVGDPTRLIHAVAPFDQAGPRDLAFAVDASWIKQLKTAGAGAVMVPETLDISFLESMEATFIVCEHPKQFFFKMLSWFYPEKRPLSGCSSLAVTGQNFNCGKDPVISSHVFIGDDVTLGHRVWIMPGVFIGDGVCIGDDTVIKPNVTIMERSCIGKNVLIHSGTVIGSDGFGFTTDGQGHEKIVHAGFVQIDDNVEIGACNTIDRGTMGRTWVGQGVKTDNQVHIAHNVTIGPHTLLVAQTGIAGSSTLGRNVIIAGKAGVSGHLNVGDGAIVGPGAGVTRDVPPGEIVSGMPEMPHKNWLKVGRILPRLPEMRKLLLSLERKIKAIEKRIETE
ncbi:UDP-3-O-[3-hydroxymyristoyl] glucosamine N-acyltransferase [Desulfocicer vacuolatum DSM 3385]|uniref:UDP-3-O-acylglucosamine N-acyltransferase n=1 Tax=Desulfocicer vacuolatum DSM 3385 TaxID=1121400 RepID=A0A1W1ZL58_9BACT|nr:UDP-3-O-(3-hydroxymyristoyl)glucosamine N-acyltransferase [Desulfocicer vacuolatum]SMC49285.1 UDP-3-O-[3-hydroxymyristoyl] glucosamine N-acyltransferase [Desulfocicer vacuolatum DSM 3385]